MHQALILLARAIALAHDHWHRSIGRRLSLSGQLAVLEERIRRLEAENTLLRARLLRVPARRRPRYRAHERLEILWHAARYRLSVTATAHLFAITRQTVIHRRRALGDKRPHLLPPPGRLSDLVRELACRLKTEWPRWGTRRIAGTLAQLGLRASRSSVQRIVRRPRPPQPDDRLLPVALPGLVARRPNHIWMIDFTRLGGLVRPVFVGAVIDAFSRRVLAVGFVRGAPPARFAVALRRRAIACRISPTRLASDEDRALRDRIADTLLPATAQGAAAAGRPQRVDRDHRALLALARAGVRPQPLPVPVAGGGRGTTPALRLPADLAAHAPGGWRSERQTRSGERGAGEVAAEVGA
jgi:hypothetical protein